MSDFRNGEIKLDSPKAVFYSGQLVSGAVSFNLSEPLNFSAINIEYIGEAEVLWTENVKEVQLGQQRIKTVEYKANEEYFKSIQCLIGGGGITQLPAGPHALPFKFHIPHTAPSSFKGEVGAITYSIKATLIFPNPNVMSEALVKEFNVVAPLDLNTGSPDIKSPINLEFEEVYGCDCICSPKPMNIRVNLPVTGYCPGQNIPITVDVDNESSTEITKMIFELICRERYRSHRFPGEYVPSEKILVKIKKGAVMGSSKKCATFNVQVPDLLPPYLENCSIIDVAYFIKVTFKLSGCNSDLTDESEICLGLIPLTNFTNGQYVHPMKDSLPDGPIPDPNQPLEFAPTSFPQPAQNPYHNEKSRLASELNTGYMANVNNMGYPGGNPYTTPHTTYPAPQTGYPAPQTGYPAPQTGYPAPQTGYPAPQIGYPAPQTGYPTSQAAYPTQQAPYPTQPNTYQTNNPRPTSGSYRFTADSNPGYPQQGYGNTNVAGPGGLAPTAPPPYA